MKFFFSLFSLCLGAFISAAQSPASFTYLLQADSFAKSKSEAVAKLAACGRDWMVLDADFRGGEPWTTGDLSTIRAGKTGRKIIAYLSIGEAGNYRSWWRREWDANRDGKPDKGAPAFLLTENPRWKGDYRVKYWDPGWQKIILVDADTIMAAGFDGVYLDIVDGFETFEQDGNNFIDDRVNPETNQTYRRDMVDWVKAVAARVRAKNCSALLIPQNGTQLFAFPDFLAVADASGVEDLFTNGDKLQKSTDTNYRLRTLAPLIAAHRPVLDVEYARSPKLQAQVREFAAQHGLVWLLADRELKTLGVSGN